MEITAICIRNDSTFNQMSLHVCNSSELLLLEKFYKLIYELCGLPQTCYTWLILRLSFCEGFTNAFFFGLLANSGKLALDRISCQPLLARDMPHHHKIDAPEWKC